MPPEKKLTRRKTPKVNVRRAVTDFLNYDNMASKFAAQANEVKLLLRDQVLPDEGTVDERGHSWIMFEDDPISDPAGKGDVVGIQRQRRAPKTLNTEKAEALLRKKRLWDSCTEQITVINEDAILAAAFAKTLTEEELQSIYDIKETFAFIPQRRK
jgi:hypothetical protein